MKQLERLLLFQGNRCFFCDRHIPEGEASVEHLVASSNGGTNDDENCVVCCRTLNAAFGNRPYKEKLRAIVSQRSEFTCPVQPSSICESPASASRPPVETITKCEVVLVDLRKRGSARPRKVATLRNTIAALFHRQLTEAQLSAIFAELVAAGHVIVNENNVTYNLPAADA